MTDKEDDEILDELKTKLLSFTNTQTLQVLKDILSNKLQKNHPKSYFSNNLKFSLMRISTKKSDQF